MLLELDRVSKTYDSVAGAPPMTVLRDVSLRLVERQAMAIVGPSGSGKSTLLNIIGTLDRPTSGRIHFEGRDLTELSEPGLAELRACKIGWVFQLHHLLPQLTALENILVPQLANARVRDAAAVDRARNLLAQVGLADRADYRPGRLSGGERQRVAVVRALINQPKLILADEPTGALDHAAAANLADLLLQLNQAQGVAMIVVTHSLELARRIGQVALLSEGMLTEVR